MTKSFSLLDTDLYKFTMGQIVFHKFSNAIVRYDFKCRNKDITFTSQMQMKIWEEIQNLCSVSFNDIELDYLESLDLFKPSYLEFLKMLRLDHRHVHLHINDGGELSLFIEGPWFTTIYFEVPLLAIINEVYFKNIEVKASINATGERLLAEKIKLIRKEEDFKFADFGTRRRFSFEWQGFVLDQLVKHLPENIVGTSNVYYAKKLNISPIGTMAHEFLQASQALGPKLINSQKFALQTWADEYRGKIGIALSDVVGMQAFLRDFDLYFSKLFDGARHDSGDPEVWCDHLISHYQHLNINPITKTAVFSDGLDFPEAIRLHTRYKKEIKTSFGIGTNLMNDMGVKALNIVIKMVECNGYSVAKISDSPGKQMCKDESYLKYLKSVFKI